MEYLEFEFYDKNWLAFTCVLKSIHKSESAYNMFGLLDAFRFSFISSYEEMIMAFHKLRKKISRRKEDVSATPNLIGRNASTNLPN